MKGRAIRAAALAAVAAGSLAAVDWASPQAAPPGSRSLVYAKATNESATTGRIWRARADGSHPVFNIAGLEIDDLQHAQWSDASFSGG